MKPEEQRIAIAEACGWVKHEKFHRWYSPNANEAITHCQASLPDYLNDLNAMREAEATIRHDSYRWGIYVTRELPRASQDITHATASQRAEAFLKTLGLWEDEP